jgi:hypothetical protein
MSTTTTQHTKSSLNERSDRDVSLHGTRPRKQPRHLGTFADGQRASSVTVIYSADVGSFGDTAAK